MFFNPKDAAGLQDGVEVGKGLLGPALRHPIVDVSESQNLIDAIGRCHWHGSWTKRHHVDIAIDTCVASEAGAIGIYHLANNLRVGRGCIKVANN
ncbi:MAG TPA: hypothetical protein DIU09_07935 [Hyphomonadaceae bacterium]|nr:hypothetical protein [Hyphomonadaceae bacterium]